MAPRETAIGTRSRPSRSRSASKRQAKGGSRKGRNTPAGDASPSTSSERSSVVDIMTFDGMRREISRITAEEEAKWPAYYKTVCYFTGLKRAQDMKSLLWISIYFGSAYVLWNWQDTTLDRVMEGLKVLVGLIGGNVSTIQKYMGAINTCAYSMTYLINVYFSFLGAVITHNTMHQQMFRWNWANKVIQVRHNNYGGLLLALYHAYDI